MNNKLQITNVDWVECKLGDIAYIYNGNSINARIKKEKYETCKTGLNYIGTKDVGFDGIINYNNGVKIPFNEPKFKIAPKGAVLVCSEGGSAGRKVGYTNEKICFGNKLFAITNKYSVFEGKFVFYYTRYRGFFQAFRNQMNGIIGGVSVKKFSTIQIPLAPLPIQRAIVSKIESLFSDLDNGIANLKKAQEQLKIYRQAVLKKAFEGELTKEWRKKNPYTMDDFLISLKKEKKEAIKQKLIQKDEYFPEFENTDLTYKVPKNWISLPWKTIVSNNKYAMKRGPFGSALKKSFFVEKGIVVYEQGHAINDDPYRHRYFITDEKFEELKAFKVQAGDMIISCSGVTLGRICLLPEDADLGIINQALLKIDLDEKILLKKFFIMLFRSETFQRLIFQKSLGSAMPNMVSMSELKKILIPIPSIQEQNQIVQEIEKRLSVTDKIEESIKESLQKAEALRQSILKKAFEGKLLTEQEIEQCKKEPDYEPASVLLERIKSEKK